LSIEQHPRAIPKDAEGLSSPGSRKIIDDRYLKVVLAYPVPDEVVLTAKIPEIQRLTPSAESGRSQGIDSNSDDCRGWI
jgi:hypothetical protein